MNLVERAMVAHTRHPGAMQPSARGSQERRVNGRNYVVLRNSSDLLAVYRVLPRGTLKKLKRWPAEFNAE